MPNNNEQQYQPLTFDAIRIGLASPEKILEWSRGEVTKPETINYRTLKPEKDGLFCERIFGPSKDWECHCGKYKKIRYKGVVCDRCGVEVTKSSVRRERMGHIALAAPVSHIWYFKGIPSRMGLILDISPRTLERVLYFASYIVLDKGETDLQNKQILSEAEYQEQKEKWGSGAFRVGMGAEAIKELLEAIDLEKECEELQKSLENATGQKRARIVKRLEVVEALRKSGVPIADVSAGSTPTGILAAETGLVNEVRPGTYIFKDFMLTKENAGTMDEIAVRFYATVVSTNHKEYAVIDGGTKCFPTDVVPMIAPFYYPGYALVEGNPDLHLSRMNEEHGIITSDSGDTGLHVGQVISLIPNHVCTAINMQNEVYLLENGELRKEKVAARGMLV